MYAQAEQIRARLLSKRLLDQLKSFAKPDSGAVGQEIDFSRLHEIRKLPAEKQKEFLGKYLNELTATSLRIPIDEMDVKAPLRMLGLDSLVGVEIKSSVDRAFVISTPIELFITEGTLDRLAEALLPLVRHAAGSLDDIPETTAQPRNDFGPYVVTDPTRNLSLKSIAMPPSFGDNYNLGYIGFTSPVKDRETISIGITYFEHYHKLSEISVTHAFVVTGENSCIEALTSRGICDGDLNAYFSDPKTHIFFRKPADYTRDIGRRIAEKARLEVGKRFDDFLIAAFALRGSFFGRFVQSIFGSVPPTDLNQYLHGNSRWICSELAAHCMDNQLEYHSKGVLARDDSAVDPQDLFEDEVIFTPWRSRKATGALVGTPPGNDSMIARTTL